MLITFVFEYIVRSSAAIFSNKSVMMLVNLPSLEWFTPSVHTYRCSFHPREYITRFSKSIYSHIESLMTHPVPPARSCTVQHCDPIIRPRYLEIVDRPRLNHWKSWADWAGCLKKNSQQKQRKNPHQKPHHVFLFLREPQLEKMIQNGNHLFIWPSLKLTNIPWNLAVGRRSFPFGAFRPIFRGYVSFSEGKFLWLRHSQIFIKENHFQGFFSTQSHQLLLVHV